MNNASTLPIEEVWDGYKFDCEFDTKNIWLSDPGCLGYFEADNIKGLAISIHDVTKDY